MSEKRTDKFQRNEPLENLLFGLNGDLQVSEEKLVEQYRSKPIEQPTILVVGSLRSGTTFFTQWLANTGLVAYPTNLLSRFYQAPVIGAKIQLLLTDPRFNFRDELGEFVQQAEYTSENGKTQGVLAPNEFWYFWRRFLADPSRDVWSDDELKQSMDVQTMKAELIGLMDVLQKPFAAKGMLFNYNIAFLDSILEKVIFVYIKRDPLMNVQSVLQARERQLGSQNAWYSFDIPEKKQLQQLAPLEQVAGQVGCIHHAVEQGLAHVSSMRKIEVSYEDFCAAPQKVYTQLVERVGHQSSSKHINAYAGEHSFESKQELKLTKNEAKKALAAYQSWYQR